jgi:outer membrane immunogenic protein
MTKLRLLATLVRAVAIYLTAVTFVASLPTGALAAPAGPTWTGCYLGGNLGGAWAHKEYTDEEFAPMEISQGSHNENSIAGGAQFGCDYQVKNWVVGLQGWIDATDLNGSNIDPSTLIAPFTMKGEISWLATAAGRIGYTLTPETLLYGKAGAAWIRGHDSRSGTIGGVFVTYTEPDTTTLGWTLGLGLERMIARHWSVFAEYDYMEFSRRTTWTRNTDGSHFPEDIDAQVQTLLAGINYRF